MKQFTPPPSFHCREESSMVGLSRKGTSVMARLEKLSVKGFTSIRSLEDFPLADSNILIGANGSGKSNFLELFKFVLTMFLTNQNM